MATVRTSPRAPQARHSAGPLRVLWLAALLFGFLYTHGMNAETVTSHLTSNAVTIAPAAAHAGDGHPAGEAASHAPPGHGDGQESHPAGECVTGQPQPGPGLEAPSPVPLAAALSCRTAVAGESGAASDRPEPPPLEFSARSVVQRI